MIYYCDQQIDLKDEQLLLLDHFDKVGVSLKDPFSLLDIVGCESSKYSVFSFIRRRSGREREIVIASFFVFFYEGDVCVDREIHE